jgi:hypothetical protein
MPRLLARTHDEILPEAGTYSVATAVLEAPPEFLEVLRHDERFDSGEVPIGTLLHALSIPRPPPLPQLEDPLPQIKVG